jgi:hypothetical protein
MSATADKAAAGEEIKKGRGAHYDWWAWFQERRALMKVS